MTSLRTFQTTASAIALAVALIFAGALPALAQGRHLGWYKGGHGYPYYAVPPPGYYYPRPRYYRPPPPPGYYYAPPPGFYYPPPPPVVLVPPPPPPGFNIIIPLPIP